MDIVDWWSIKINLTTFLKKQKKHSETIKKSVVPEQDHKVRTDKRRRQKLFGRGAGPICAEWQYATVQVRERWWRCLKERRSTCLWERSGMALDVQLSPNAIKRKNGKMV